MPTVGIAVSYAVGHRDDPDGRRQLAHVLEHALCGATGHIPKGTAAYLESLGALVRGSTHPDFTLLAEEPPREQWR